MAVIFHSNNIDVTEDVIDNIMKELGRLKTEDEVREVLDRIRAGV